MGIPLIRSRRQEYWYVVAHKSEGNLIVRGGYKSERVAKERGYYDLSGIPFETEPLPYNNLQRATSHFKEMELQKTHDLEHSVQRAVHKALNPDPPPYKEPETYRGKLHERLEQRRNEREQRLQRRRE